MGLRLHPACECDNVGATASTSTSVGRGCVVCVCGAVCGVYLWVLARCVFVGAGAVCICGSVVVGGLVCGGCVGADICGTCRWSRRNQSQAWLVCVCSWCINSK